MTFKKNNRSATKFLVGGNSFHPQIEHDARRHKCNNSHDIVHIRLGIFFLTNGKARNEVQQDTSHGDAEHHNIAGPERICNSGRIEVDGDRLRQAVIESEKDC